MTKSDAIDHLKAMALSKDGGKYIGYYGVAELINEIYDDRFLDCSGCVFQMVDEGYVPCDDCSRFYEDKFKGDADGNKISCGC